MVTGDLCGCDSDRRWITVHSFLEPPMGLAANLTCNCVRWSSRWLVRVSEAAMEGDRRLCWNLRRCGSLVLANPSFK